MHLVCFIYLFSASLRGENFGRARVADSRARGTSASTLYCYSWQ